MILNELDKSNKNSEIGLAEKRAELDKKLKATFESIFEKYSKDFNGIGDEIDIATGEVVIDNGHLLRMQSKGKDDVWNCTRNQKTRIDDESLENLLSPKICSIICDEDDEEQDLRGNPVVNEENASESESECDCDCYEDDLILRGFVRANRFLKFPSEDKSRNKLDMFQGNSTLDSLSPNTENISEVNKIINKESSHTEPTLLDQSYDDTAHEDEIELAWRLPRLSPTQQGVNNNTIEKAGTEKLFTLHANLSFNSKSVEHWGLEREARRSKLESHNYSYFSNYSPAYSNQRMETNVSGCGKSISRDSSISNWKAEIFRGEEIPLNLDARETLSSGTDSKDSEEPMAKHRSIACEQEKTLQNAEFTSITKYEVSQKPDISIHRQKISGSNYNSLLNNNDLIFDDVRRSSNHLPTPTSVPDDTLKLNVPLDGSNASKVYDNGIISSSSIKRNFPYKKSTENGKKNERPSSNIPSNQATVIVESSTSLSKKPFTNIEKHEARNSRSPIQIKKKNSYKSFGKPSVVPKQKFNQPASSMKVNQKNSENFSISKPIPNQKTNIKPPVHLHTKKPSPISTPIKINASIDSPASKHKNLVPVTPNRNFNLGAKTTSSKSLWRKAVRNSHRQSPKSEDLDELSLDQPSQSQNSIFKTCDNSEILEQSPKVFSTVKKKSRRLFSKLEDENDEDELSIHFKNSSSSKRKSI